ncbi:hypothetical protein [Stigmatella aurantiaca]|uniref:hypothetical protein n=1 Tax=Stigmatella aurantiaca TaxID=41 RepID=UPI00056249AA|nr:hypothetical protein [Stigmatella aurantiaca]
MRHLLHLQRRCRLSLGVQHAHAHQMLHHLCHADGVGAERIVDIGDPGSLEQSAAAVALRGQVSLVGALGEGAPITDP